MLVVIPVNKSNCYKDVFTIRHTVTVFTLDGKKKMIAKDKAKSQTSRRFLPLVHFLKRWLLEKKKEQEQNRILCGRSYNQKFIDYVCVDQMGDMIRPDYITAAFPEFLEKKASAGSGFMIFATHVLHFSQRMGHALKT